VTHRLDRPTSGVVLFARTSKALTRLNEMFKSHEQIRKTYWAIVQGAPKVPEARLQVLNDRKTAFAHDAAYVEVTVGAGRHLRRRIGDIAFDPAQRVGSRQDLLSRAVALDLYGELVAQAFEAEAHHAGAGERTAEGCCRCRCAAVDLHGLLAQVGGNG
ncbi:MAG: RNA pseudouridine synthase, partial [Firmicutes bacterium]|nr:RNA pseudouridine synthase [Bacillota bacterium]